MRSRLFIALIWVFLGIMTATAIILAPGKVKSGRTMLKWTTDSCPERDIQVETFNQLNPDCYLQIDPDNSGVMKVVIQSSAHMGPDLIDHVNVDSVQTYADSGILWDVSKEAEKMGFGLSTLPEKIQPLVKMTTITKDGKLVEGQAGYPCNIGHITLFYNKNLFDKMNIPYPSSDLTWDEYISLAQKMTVKTPDDVVPSVFGAAGTQIKAIIMAKGGKYFNSNATVSLVDSKEFIDAYELYYKLLYEYQIEPTPHQKTAVSSQGGWGSGFITWFGEGKVAMMWGSRWILVQLRRNILHQKEMREKWLRENPDKDPSEAPEILRIGCVMLPRFKDHERVVPSYAKCTGINVNSPNREKALKFLAYLAGKEYSMIINQGADGLPGNKKYNMDMPLLINPDFPGEEEVHQVEIDSIPYGGVTRSSPFVSNMMVNRTMRKVQEKLVATPGMTRDEIAEELKKAALEINTAISRNISRNSKLLKLYSNMLKEGAEPVSVKLEHAAAQEIIIKHQ
ncbi:MAG: extracellular solute-binding protein [Victivallales bacterium]|nr:extracellular solute-binding protein [Victivallales bacterium]